MINRAQLKEAGKTAFKRAYWKCVGVGLVLSTAIYGLTLGSMNGTIDLNDFHRSFSVSNVLPVVGGIFCGSLVLWLILKLVSSAFEVGCQGFFVKNNETNDYSPEFSEILSGFKGNFTNVAFTLVIRDLKIFLWSLLFVVPGIVKAYEYKMLPYLLAEDPNLKLNEAFLRSKEMMEGHKMDAFKLDLSFLGWDILSLCTFGILKLFYVAPYKYSTNAGLYKELKSCAA